MISRIIQSPMAGCTDLAFRLLARAHGMKFAFLEMVSAEALVRDNENTEELMKTVPEDKPLGAQIVGWRPEAMAEAARRIEDAGYDLLDLNFGCPVPKIAGRGAGAALLSKPEEAKNIFLAVVKAVKKIPVTVKMRKGCDDESGCEAVEIAKIAEGCGVSAVAVHGRTRKQGYSGLADYEAIGRVKKAVKIPVIGNGDVCSGADAKKLLEVSGCDGVMIGRGALGNPWIYREIEAVLSGEAAPLPPGLEEKKKTLLRHFELELEHRDEYTAILMMRRIACWYVKSLPGSAEFRGLLNTCDTTADMRQIIEDFSGKSLELCT